MNKEELIAQYLSNNLSEKEKKEFDLLISTDLEFASEVTFQKNLKVVIEKEEQQAVKSQLQDFDKEETSSFSYKKLMVAASVVILLGFSTFWYFNTSVNTEKLYAEHFEPYRNIVHPIVRTEAEKDLKTKAFTAYETKNYTEALELFNLLLEENTDETITFYKANVLLKLDKTNEALSIFEENLKTPDSLDDKNSWYLALTHLRLNNIENAKAILKELDTSSSFKNKNVKQLLKKLD